MSGLSSCALPVNRQTAPAFTLVEMLVVISIMVLVLALAVPSLSSMATQSRFTAAEQTVRTAMTRAYYTAVSDVNMTAVRFLPGSWDSADGKAVVTPRQHLVLCRYVGTTDRELPGGTFEVAFGEQFRRIEGIESIEMPEDIWAAPLESLSTQSVQLGSGGGLFGPPLIRNFGADRVLNGELGQFRYDADRNEYANDGSDDAAAQDLLSADDFLLVFDPQLGLRAGTPRPYPLRAYAPKPNGCGYETDANPTNAGQQYTRYAFSGVVIYRREPFAELAADASELGLERQEHLKQFGRPYLARPLDGGLLSGVQSP